MLERERERERVYTSEHRSRFDLGTLMQNFIVTDVFGLLKKLGRHLTAEYQFKTLWYHYLAQSTEAP